MYTHWLGVGGIRKTLLEEDQQWKNLKYYIDNYPESTVTIFFKETGRDLFEKIVKLECDQNYQNLELDCNSGFNTSFRHLSYKPKGLEICKLSLDNLANRNTIL